MATKAKEVEYGQITPAKLRKLLALREKATQGTWEVDKSSLGGFIKSIFITTWSRKQPDSKQGHIGSVNTTNLIFGRDRLNKDKMTEHENKNATTDAELIVEAVNWLKPMAEALLDKKSLTDTAWVIEWPEDRHHTTRYYSAGELPVRNINHATRFSRKEDAERTAKDYGKSGYHGWTVSEYTFDEG